MVAQVVSREHQAVTYRLLQSHAFLPRQSCCGCCDFPIGQQTLWLMTFLLGPGLSLSSHLLGRQSEDMTACLTSQPADLSEPPSGSLHQSIISGEGLRAVLWLQVSVRQRALKVMQLVGGDASAAAPATAVPAPTANGHQQPMTDLLGSDPDEPPAAASASAAAVGPDLLGEAL